MIVVNYNWDTSISTMMIIDQLNEGKAVLVIMICDIDEDGRQNQRSISNYANLSCQSALHT